MPRLRLLGFEHDNLQRARRVFESSAPAGWTLVDDASADAALIDLDSMYGQMAWMGGLPSGQVSIGLTHAARASTGIRLAAPLEGSALAAALDGVARSLAGDAATPPRADDSPLVEPVASTARLADHLASAQGVLRIDAEGLPALVIDVAGQRFAPGKSLKALLGYATADLPPTALRALGADDAAAAFAAAGEPQPLSRLVWLLALGAGGGRLEGHGAGTRFQLTRWPQVEREFPRHFRIATVMLKAPATVAEVALASGASESDVSDYIHAALACGYARIT
jgi:hypothetical protein